MSVDVEVRGACPACGGNETTRKGQAGQVIYRQCNDCGRVFKAIRYTALQIAQIVLTDGMVIELKEIDNLRFDAMRRVGERL